MVMTWSVALVSTSDEEEPSPQSIVKARPSWISTSDASSVVKRKAIGRLRGPLVGATSSVSSGALLLIVIVVTSVTTFVVGSPAGPSVTVSVAVSTMGPSIPAASKSSQAIVGDAELYVSVCGPPVIVQV